MPPDAANSGLKGPQEIEGHSPNCAYFTSYPVSEGSTLVPCDCGAWERYEAAVEEEYTYPKRDGVPLERDA